MKINNIGTQGINPYHLQSQKAEKANMISAKKTDKLEISSAAKEMQSASAANVTAARQEKINSLKVQVENGTYKIDAKATAKGIINFYAKNND
ncbi:flagellar biosynthesis anti-sigma factor FlgM [Bacillus massiliglaciei]|uniref:flagellar biosynthesis anti-sigma factor FlgM n=1 Tax=Bacillus massiliglaciei TaxID=1816693 RepID=UPI000DA5F058|nr:flagellar biosynthesis anti-sigma factor FlgM [Bacillus massiliglaciei]